MCFCLTPLLPQRQQYHNMEEIKAQDIRVEEHKGDGSIDIETASVANAARHATGGDAFYQEALEKYGQEGSIDPVVEKTLVRKIDLRILPILGVCYFFYVSSSKG